MSIGYTRHFRGDDIGYKDRSKLNETVNGEKLKHEAGIRAYDPSKLNPIVRFFAGILNRTVDYTDDRGNTVVLGRRSLEAFMVRNSIIKSRVEFDPKTAEGLLKKFLQNKDSLVPTQADIHFEKDKLVVSKQGLKDVFNALGVKTNARTALKEGFQEVGGKYEISKKALFEKIEQHKDHLSAEAAKDVPRELRPIRDRFIQFVMSHDPKQEKALEKEVDAVLHAPIQALDLGDLESFATYQLQTKAGDVWTNKSVLNAVHRLSLHTKKDAYPQRTHVRDLQQVAAYLWIKGGGWNEESQKVFNEFPLLDKAITIWCAMQKPRINNPVEKKVVDQYCTQMMNQLVSHYDAASQLGKQENERKALDAFLNTHEKGKELKAEFNEVLQGIRKGAEKIPADARSAVLQATAKEFGIT